MLSTIFVSALAIIGAQAQGGPPGGAPGGAAPGAAPGGFPGASPGGAPGGGKGGAPGGFPGGAPGGGKGGAPGGAPGGGKGGAPGGGGGKGGAAKGGAKGGSGGLDLGSFLGGVIGTGAVPQVLSGISSISSQGKVPLGPAPKGCAAFEVMYARGTFEPGPFGVIVGDPLMNQVAKDMRGENVRGYAVQYPASMGGADIGISDIVNRVKEKARECPTMKFALVGYSQGGMVTSSAFAKIPQDLRKNVVAMVLYGSGKGDMGSADIKQKTMANCAPNDMCGTPSGAAGHITYGSTGTAWHARSSKFMANGFHGQALKYTLHLNPN